MVQLTLPAGYLGSSFIGAALIAAVRQAGGGGNQLMRQVIGLRHHRKQNVIEGYGLVKEG